MTSRNLITSFLLFFAFSLQLAAAPPTLPEVKTYEQLVRAIRGVRAASQQRIEAAVESEKVREAWETGKLIQGHILLNKDRAEYGAQVMRRLSADLGISYTELKYMREFVRTYPEIGRAPGQLSWSHIQSLLAVNDENQRQAIASEALSKNWSQDDLRREIKKRKLPTSEDPKEILSPLNLGELNTYQIFKQEGRLKIDLGFDTYLDLPKPYRKKVKEGEIVTLDGSRHPKRATPNDLYTYAANVTQVVDGDTFYALIDLGFGITLYQRLRLRRLDAPEIIAAEGKEAKAALEKILSPATSHSSPVMIKISKTDDQYGRYLADVFLPTSSLRGVRQQDSGGRRGNLDSEDYISVDQDLLHTNLFTVRGDV